MWNRIRVGLGRPGNRQSQGYQLISPAVFIPRLWKIMIVCAYPFLVICTNYFEALERTGTIGAIIADMLMPAAIIGYVVLIVVLKKREV